MDLKSYKFQYYPANIETKTPLGEINLYELLYSIKHPKPEILEVFKQIEQASNAGDKKLKAELKSKLFYMNPCVYTDGKGRRYENILKWTRLLIIDVDNLEPSFAVELKHHLFETHP